jgi:hypothetical protein
MVLPHLSFLLRGALVVEGASKLPYPGGIFAVIGEN